MSNTVRGICAAVSVGRKFAVSGTIRRNLAPFVHALDQVGGMSPPVVAVVVLFIMLLQYAVDAVAYFAQALVGETAFYAFAPLAFVCCAALAIWLVRRHYRPRPAIVDRTGLGAHTLILFLSPPANRKPNESDDEWRAGCFKAAASLEAIAHDPEQLRRFAYPWRMPLESALAHRGTLRRVVVIPSPETEPYVDAFRQCAQAFLGEKVEVVDARVFTGMTGRVDFATDLEGLLELVDAVYAETERRKEPADQVVVDVTGGTKICSLAGLAAVQPFPARCFQYVFAASGSPAQVRIWDVTFELDQRPA